MNREQRRTEAKALARRNSDQGKEGRPFPWRWCLGAMVVAAILGSVGLTWAPAATYAAVPLVFLACGATLGGLALYHLARYIRRKLKCSPSRS